MVRAIAESLFSAWNYLHLLQGFQQGTKAHPIVVQQFERLFDQIWRGVFDGLFAKVGTLIDRTKSTYSLPNLLTMARRYGRAALKVSVAEVEACLNAQDGPLAKIESWRHNVVAHRTTDGREAAFYIDNKMNLEDIATALTQLEKLLSTISRKVIREDIDTESGSEDLVQQGAALFAHIAERLAGRAERPPS